MNQKQYKNPVCRGSIMLGSACGRCEKCRDEIDKMRSDIQSKPLDTIMDTFEALVNHAKRSPRVGLCIQVDEDRSNQGRLLDVVDFAVSGSNKVIKNRYGPRGEIVEHDVLEQLLSKEEELERLKAQKSFTEDEVKEIVNDVLVHISCECRLSEYEVSELKSELETSLSSKWCIEYESTQPEETIPVTLATIEATCGWYEFATLTGENEWMLREHHVEPHEIFHVKKSDAIKLRLIRGED